jgi:hypothetical protein
MSTTVAVLGGMKMPNELDAHGAMLKQGHSQKGWMYNVTTPK